MLYKWSEINLHFLCKHQWFLHSGHSLRSLIKYFSHSFIYIWFRFRWIYKEILHYCNLRKVIKDLWGKITRYQTFEVKVLLQKMLSIIDEEELEMPVGCQQNNWLVQINLYFNYALIFLPFFSCYSMPHSSCSALHAVNPN